MSEAIDDAITALYQLEALADGLMPLLPPETPRTPAGIIAAVTALHAVAKAAMAWRDQRHRNLFAALAMTEEEIKAESREVGRARQKLTADLARAIETALKAVRP